MQLTRFAGYGKIQWINSPSNNQELSAMALLGFSDIAQVWQEKEKAFLQVD